MTSTLLEPAPAQAGTRRGARYARISDDHAGDEHGVTNQLADEAAYAARRGITIAGGHTYTDNDISATYGKLRPRYRAMMEAAARGELDVIIVFHTSRLWRNRKERAEGIEILMRAGVSIEAVKGPSLDMSTAYGRGMAGLLGEFDTMESEVKRERQQLFNESAAGRGEVRKGGVRRFGWKPGNAEHEPAEAEAVRAACRRLLSSDKVTLSAVVAEWTRNAHDHVDGYRPAKAPFGPLMRQAWTYKSVEQILLNPANAGLSVWHGEVVADGKWEAIVSPETQRAVRAKLAAGPRATPEGKERRTGRSLLGSLALCPCGAVMYGAARSGVPGYRCSSMMAGNGAPGGHVRRPAAPVDDYVRMVVTGRLSRPDAASLLTVPGDTDAEALREEAAAIRENLAEMARERVRGELTPAEHRAARQEAGKRLAEIAEKTERATGENVLAPIVTAEDKDAAWEALDLAGKRAVIDALMTVTLLSPGLGRRPFEPGTVGIEWRRGQ